MIAFIDPTTKACQRKKDISAIIDGTRQSESEDDIYNSISIKMSAVRIAASCMLGVFADA